MVFGLSWIAQPFYLASQLRNSPLPEPLKLYSRSYGEGHPLIILHGLLGSSGNWHTLASRVFGKSYRVIVVDQRNHGRSPHSEAFSYDAMSEDVVELMDDLAIESAHLLGHSMGGKTAMHFALQHSERVNGLVVVDIAPVDYPHLHRKTLDALITLNLTGFSSREQIDSALEPSFPEASMRNFLLKGVVRGEAGFEWMFNLDAINKGYSSLMEAVLGWQPFEGPTLFVHGGKSTYVQQEHLIAIRTQFPYAEISTIEQAGHWIHSDEPDEFGKIVMSFLESV